jgi:DNA-binding NarL/FixJ family response regulator
LLPTPHRTTIRVFLLDDHEVVRRGVAAMLEAEGDIDVVGEAGSAEQALARIPAADPHVAVLDIRLPDGDGVTVCREIRSHMSRRIQAATFVTQLRTSEAKPDRRDTQ